MNQDRILARGARPGDRLCSYAPAISTYGCETVSAGDEQMQVIANPDWQPESRVSPVNTTTIDITVLTQKSMSETLQAQLYPLNDPATSPITLTYAGKNLEQFIYIGTLTATFEALDGYVHLWVVEEGENNSRREMVTDYAMGGNPGHKKSGFGRSRPILLTKNRGLRRCFLPMGKRFLFGPQLDQLKVGDFYVLQAATQLPQVAPPAWATHVGRAYRLSASQNITDLNKISLAFNYLGNEVPAVAEQDLTIYFWNEDQPRWEAQVTHPSPENDIASAHVVSEGLYALMYSIEIPLPGTGWNLFGYPIQGRQRITEAISFLGQSGAFTGTFTLYGYDALASDPLQRWQVYDSQVARTNPAANSLTHLEFGRGYWITGTHGITLLLKDALPDTTLETDSAQKRVSHSSRPISNSLLLQPSMARSTTRSISWAISWGKQTAPCR